MASPAICLNMGIFVIALIQAQAHAQIQVQANDYLNSSSVSLSAGTCEHIYGFFPCAENIPGYLVEIVIYQYLMIVGGQLIGDGSKTLFNMLGTGIFGATLFRVLLNFPRLIFVIMSGAFSTQEDAQRQVALSVGIYAGSTVLILTILWGIVLIVGREEIPENQSSIQEPTSQTPLLDKEDKDIFSELKETGVKTDVKTSYTAGIMLLSLIPFAIAETVNFFNTTSASRVVLLIALIVSATSLISYFIYQLWDPWIQERSLEYSKYQHLVTGFLNYVQRETKGKLVDANGKPNVSVIQGLFSQQDKDMDKSLTLEELQKLMEKIQAGEVEVDKNYAVSEVLKVFDLNSDGRISEDEFVEGSKKWIDEAKKLDENTQTTGSLTETIQPYTKKRRDELAEIENLMGNILKGVRSQVLKAKLLVKDDGSLNIEHIQTLFKQFGSGDNSISESELKQLIQSVKFGDEGEVNTSDATVITVMRGFDEDGNNTIDEKEFMNEAKKWLNIEAVQVERVNNNNESAVEPKESMWEEFDNLIRKTQQCETIKGQIALAWSYAQPILKIIFGVTMLTVIAKPFMVNIVMLTNTIGLDASFISFIVIPIIMNARDIISALRPPISQKSSTLASLTYSEMYGDVIMNNIMGLTTILAIIYAKELPWDYSAEVIIIVMVCCMVGFFAMFSDTYPLWTSLFAFFLYIFAFGVFFVLHFILGWN